jgi:hypothetical protein
LTAGVSLLIGTVTAGGRARRDDRQHYAHRAQASTNARWWNALIMDEETSRYTMGDIARFAFAPSERADTVAHVAFDSIELPKSFREVAATFSRGSPHGLCPLHPAAMLGPL